MDIDAEKASGLLVKNRAGQPGEAVLDRFEWVAAQHGVPERTQITHAIFTGQFTPPVSELRIVFNALVPDKTLQMSPELSVAVRRAGRSRDRESRAVELEEQIRSGSFVESEGDFIPATEIVQVYDAISSLARINKPSQSIPEALVPLIYELKRVEAWDQRYGSVPEVAKKLGLFKSTKPAWSGRSILEWRNHCERVRWQTFIPQLPGNAWPNDPVESRRQAIKQLNRIGWFRFGNLKSGNRRMAIEMNGRAIGRTRSAIAPHFSKAISDAGWELDAEAPWRLSIERISARDSFFFSGQMVRLLPWGPVDGPKFDRSWSPKVEAVRFRLTAPAAVPVGHVFCAARVVVHQDTVFLHDLEPPSETPDPMAYAVKRFLSGQDLPVGVDGSAVGQLIGALGNQPPSPSRFDVDLARAAEKDWKRLLELVSADPDSLQSLEEPVAWGDVIVSQALHGSGQWVRTSEGNSEADGVVREKLLGSLGGLFSDRLEPADPGFYLHAHTRLSMIEDTSAFPTLRAHGIYQRLSLDVLNAIVEIDGRRFRMPAEVVPIGVGAGIVQTKNQTWAADVLLREHAEEASGLLNNSLPDVSPASPTAWPSMVELPSVVKRFLRNRPRN